MTKDARLWRRVKTGAEGPVRNPAHYEQTVFTSLSVLVAVHHQAAGIKDAFHMGLLAAVPYVAASVLMIAKPCIRSCALGNGVCMPPFRRCWWYCVCFSVVRTFTARVSVSICSSSIAAASRNHRQHRDLLDPSPAALSVRRSGSADSL